MKERMDYDTVEGPLTDNEYSGSDEDEDEDEDKDKDWDSDSDLDLDIGVASTGGDDEEAPGHSPGGDEEATGHSPGAEVKTREQKQKQRKIEGKQKKRARDQVEEGTEVKKVKKVCVRHGEVAVQGAIKVDYDALLDATITLPAWTGMHATELPRQLFTRSELESLFKIDYYQWDGRYVYSFM